MNVRFAHGQVRFRTERSELATLLAGRTLSMRVELSGQHAFRATVSPGRLASWRLDSDPTGLWLVIPLKELEAFANDVPTSEGIAHRFELENGATVDVTFEVDVRG